MLQLEGVNHYTNNIFNKKSNKYIIMRRVFLIIFYLSFIVAGFSKPVLPEIISDNMVLQQKTNVTIWGRAHVGETIVVKPSWSSISAQATVGKDGAWVVSIATPEASFTPHSISISDGEEVVLNNVLIGEVWLASGQSNMEMPLSGFWNNPIMGANETIANSANNKGIRFAILPKTTSMTPQETVKGMWKESNPANAAQFSATAYHFAETLYKSMQVPIGIIVSSWGGTRVEGWTNKKILETYPDIDLDEKAIEALNPMAKPMLMYNAMIHPLINYTLKGFIWYQGESNVGKHEVYAQRLGNMVELWRSDWNLGNLPFYYAEIAPYEYGDGKAAYLREAQYKAQALIANSGMISTNDLVEEYEATNIHPKNKTDVGKRLGYMALNDTYGYKDIMARGPEYKSMEVKDGTVVLSFNHTDNGFAGTDGLEGFEIAGSDEVFHPATAAIDYSNRTVVVSNKNIANPTAVRYCFKNFQIGNLYNTRELPAVPFRTDEFEVK